MITSFEAERRNRPRSVTPLRTVKFKHHCSKESSSDAVWDEANQPVVELFFTRLTSIQRTSMVPLSAEDDLTKPSTFESIREDKEGSAMPTKLRP